MPENKIIYLKLIKIISLLSLSKEILEIQVLNIMWLFMCL